MNQRGNRPIMRHIITVFAGVAALAGGATRLAAQERGYVVIVNQSNPITAVSSDELSRLFMKKTARWTTGQEVVPVDLAESAPAREQFSQDVHHKPVAAVKAYWQTMIFSGRGVPPMEAPSEQSVVAFVRSTPGAIAYVSAQVALGPGVRRIRVDN